MNWQEWLRLWLLHIPGGVLVYWVTVQPMLMLVIQQHGPHH